MAIDGALRLPATDRAWRRPAFDGANSTAREADHGNC
jgi:hypothetical protein